LTEGQLEELLTPYREIADELVVSVVPNRRPSWELLSAFAS
jgi:hypothetical protein